MTASECHSTCTAVIAGVFSSSCKFDNLGLLCMVLVHGDQSTEQLLSSALSIPLKVLLYLTVVHDSPIR